MALPIVLVTTELQTRHTVSAALTEGRFAPTETCSDLHELELRLDRQAAPAVLVDIDPHPHGMLSTLAPIIERFDRTRFVVLASDLRNELLIEAMQAGARHFLAKQTISVDLQRVLGKLIPNGHSAGEDGFALAVLSASGGCGATTLAVNLAHEIAAQANKQSLLVDMDASYGAVASCLGLSGQYGLADVLAHGEKADSELIRSSSIEHSSQLRVLLSPASVNLGEARTSWGGNMRSVAQAAKNAYHCAVFDAPRLEMSVAADLASECLRTLIVFQLTVKDIHTLRAMLAALSKYGLPEQRILPVACRCQKRNRVLSLEEARKAIGSLPVAEVCNDFASAIHSINFGQPLSQAAPRSPLRQDIRRLAGEMATLAQQVPGGDR